MSAEMNDGYYEIPSTDYVDDGPRLQRNLSDRPPDELRQLWLDTIRSLRYKRTQEEKDRIIAGAQEILDELQPSPPPPEEPSVSGPDTGKSRIFYRFLGFKAVR